MSTLHTPVLLSETLEGLRITHGKRYIDGTLGLGGHAAGIESRGGTVLGIDADEDALRLARARLSDAATLVHGNFRDIARIATEHGFVGIDGVLLDLGVSSMQLDTPQKGMSYRFTDAPLDLRLDQGHGDTAAQLVNRCTEDELYDIVAEFGEERLARSVAHAIHLARAVRRIETVGDLTEAIATVVPNERERSGVLSRVFQGIRIAVNDELGSLKLGLDGAGQILAPGGRLAVITFHSLEDRIVKLFMRGKGWKAVTKHPVRPTEREIAENRRSRSAKLRIAERV